MCWLAQTISTVPTRSGSHSDIGGTSNEPTAGCSVVAAATNGIATVTYRVILWGIITQSLGLLGRGRVAEEGVVGISATNVREEHRARLANNVNF